MDLGGRERRPPPPALKFFQFYAVFGKIWQNRMLAPPPRGNPGSATSIHPWGCPVHHLECIAQPGGGGASLYICTCGVMEYGASENVTLVFSIFFSVFHFQLFSSFLFFLLLISFNFFWHMATEIFTLTNAFGNNAESPVEILLVKETTLRLN